MNTPEPAAFPEARFRSAATVPPIVLFRPRTSIPCPLPRADVPVGSVPTKLPTTVLLFEATWMPSPLNPLIASPSDRAAGRARAQVQPGRRGAGAGAHELDHERGVQSLAERVGVGGGPRLGIAVDRQRVGDHRQRGGRRDRLHARAGDVERDGVGPVGPDADDVAEVGVVLFAAVIASRSVTTPSVALIASPVLVTVMTAISRRSSTDSIRG